MKGDPHYFHLWSMAQRPDNPGVVVPVGILAQSIEIVDLHKGMRAHKVISPSGTTHYAEVASGGELGTDLNLINLMIDDTPDYTLMYQVKKNVEVSLRLVMVDPLEFWFLLEQEGP